MIGSFRATLMLLSTRGYVLGGIGSMIGLAAVSMMINIGEVEPTTESRGPLGDSLTLALLDSPDGLAVAAGGTIGLVGIVVMAVHAAAVASDHATGTIRNLLVRQPDRWRLLAGRSLALAVFTAAAVAVVVAVAVPVALVSAPDGVDTAHWFEGAGLAALARASANLLLATLGWGLLGQVLAVVSRSAMVSLAVGVVIAIPLDLVLSDVDPVRPWLPGQLFQAISRGGTADLAYGQALLTTVAGVAAAAAAAGLLFRHRDVVA